VTRVAWVEIQQGRISLFVSNVERTIQEFVKQVQGVVLLVENPGM